MDSKFSLNNLWLLIYLPLFGLLYFLLYHFGFLKVLPTPEGLQSFDGNFYASIKDVGYQYKNGSASNAGFFPLFSYLWRWSHLGVVGICCLNSLLFLSSLYFIIKEFAIDHKVVLLFLCAPFTFFFLLPLSESLFFACCTMFLIGHNRHNNSLIVLGLLLASLTRPSFFFLIPAFIGSVWMMNYKSEIWSKTNYRQLLVYNILPCLVSLLVVVVIQYIQTGEALAYFKTQSIGWGRKFAWPMFPLSYSSNHRVNAVSISSFWTGMMIAITSLYYFFTWLIKDVRFHKDRIYLLSFIFISMALVSIVFMNPTWNWYGTGNHKSTYINGINRYIFCSAFYLLSLVYIYRHVKVSKVVIALMVASLCLVLFINGPALVDYTCEMCVPVTFVKFAWPLSFILFFAVKRTWALIPVSIIGLITQCYMLSYFMTSIQVD